MVPVTKARVKVWTYCIVAIPAMIAYLILRGDNKTKLKMDINRFWLHLRGKTPSSGWQYIAAFYYLMCGIREFRNVFYMRLGYSSLLISWLMPEMVEFSFATPSYMYNMDGHVWSMRKLWEKIFGSIKMSQSDIKAKAIPP